MDKSELIEQLILLDQDAFILFGDDQRLEVVIVGGGALIAKGLLKRGTRDIDAYRVSKKLESLISKRNMNTSVSAYFDFFPAQFETRLEKLQFDTYVIDFYLASTEDIVISKLCSCREKDYDDVTHTELIMALNWNLLERLAMQPEELKQVILSERAYEDFLLNYKRYVQENKP